MDRGKIGLTLRVRLGLVLALGLRLAREIE